MVVCYGITKNDLFQGGLPLVWWGPLGESLVLSKYRRLQSGICGLFEFLPLSQWGADSVMKSRRTGVKIYVVLL